MPPVLSEGSSLRAGRYEVVRPIGRGGVATVWLAKDSVLEREVAIKVLDQAVAADADWIARFRREARLAAQLSHPNLVAVYDFDADSEQPFLVMAHMPGGSLHEALQAGDAPPAKEVAEDLLRALDEIHAAGIIHRDVKPGNVLFDSQGRACLTDFGIARPQDATSITRVGEIPGTARYMAPELWRGEPASERTDLYSAGVLLARMLEAGDGSPALHGLTDRLRSEDPAKRPQTARAALNELSEPAPEAPTAPTQPLTHEAPPATSSSRTAAALPRRWVPVAALVAVVGVVAVALAASGGGDSVDSAGDEPAANAERQRDRSGAASGSGEQRDQPEASAEPAPEAPADAAALNDQGFALINEGRYEEAIPPLEQSVAAYREAGDTESVPYGFALFNLANALRLSGRPGEAVPLLEERLGIPNQTDVVKDELKAAKKEAKEAEKD